MSETGNSDGIRFTLDGRCVTAAAGESIWEVAERQSVAIPHLCHLPEPGYRADGNCRACMVEIEGERALAASCIRKPAPDMVVRTGSERARRARAMVLELLLADQPERAESPDRTAFLWDVAASVGVATSRFPAHNRVAPDRTHPAMSVQLDACIHCGLCVRACREVQVNDVIGMAGRGAQTRVVFDQDDPMGESTCVACGECVQACPTGALMPANLVDAASGRGSQASDEVVRSICPYCGVGCQLDFHLRDGTIAFVRGANGPANENRLCVKGRFGFDYVTSPERLTKPLIRKPGLPKALDVNPRDPSTHFREASWDEALGAAASGLARLREEYGGDAVAGFGSAKCSNEEAYLFQKVIRTQFGHNNVDHCTRLCHASSVAALMEGIGSGAVTAPFTECARSDVIAVIGANPAENHPVAATYIKQAVQRGARLIVMDPRGQALARHAAHMLRFRPGTDVALLNAIMHVIIAEGLADRQFIEARTSGFEALRKHLADYAPERVAELTGINADTVREVARAYGQAERALIFWGMGIAQHVHGTDNARCLISLAMLCGHVGRPGTGLHPLRGQNNVQGASDAGLIPMVLPDYAKVGDDGARGPFEALWGTRISPEPGLTVVEIVSAARAGEIRGMYIMGENPAMSDPDASHARQGLARLEHLVVQDIFLSETAMLADVVLPATAWPEKTGTVTNTNRQVQLGRRVVATPGEAREDWWITQEIASRLGADWGYSGPADVWAEMTRLMSSLDNIGWDRLEREGAIAYPCPAPDHPGLGVIFEDSFPTEDGRAALVPAAYGPPGEPPDPDYPMILSTGRQLEHWHTGAISRRAPVLDALEPGPTASLNPRTLARHGIEPGGRVRIETRRGTIELRARADEDVQDDVIFVPFAYAEAAANLLTSPLLDPDGKIPEFKLCAARLQRAD